MQNITQTLSDQATFLEASILMAVIGLTVGLLIVLFNQAKG